MAIANQRMMILRAKEMAEGQGAKVRRLFPVVGHHNHDPFVLLDEFFVEDGGFPTHPHRGFEAITYMIEGGFNHKDNMGNDTTVYAGGAQRFTAGSGMTHSEMPATDGMNHGFQLWINLPRAIKGIDPEYQQVDAEDMPSTEDEDLHTTHIVGENAPVQIRTDMLYEDLKFKADQLMSKQLPKYSSGFLYVYEGTLSANGEEIEDGSALLFEELSEIEINASEGSKAIIVAGIPIGETMIQVGPYVD